MRAFPSDDGVIVLVRDVTEARAITERLSRQATHDELTGLINRRELLLRLNRLVDEDAADSDDLLFIDLDRFKDINDSFGHAAGDEVLRAIGERLSGTSAEGGNVSRIEGAEFVIFIVDAPEGKEDALRLSHRRRLVDLCVVTKAQPRFTPGMHQSGRRVRPLVGKPVQHRIAAPAQVLITACTEPAWL